MYSYNKALKPLNQPEIWLLWFFSRKCLRIFRPNGVEIRIFNINSLLWRVKTNFWAKVAIEVYSSFNWFGFRNFSYRYTSVQKFHQNRRWCCPDLVKMTWNEPIVSSLHIQSLGNSMEETKLRGIWYPIFFLNKGQNMWVGSYFFAADLT